jgi:hypothetical protein
MSRRIRPITVTGVGTPPPLPLRPLVDEVLRVLDQRPRSGESAMGSRDRPPRPKRPTEAAGRPTPSEPPPERETEDG